MAATKILLILSFALAIGGLAQAQDRLPCGIVTSSIQLTASCEGPMVIAANNITIDLGGHSVGSDGNDSIIMKNRSGVVIKNGGLGGRGALRIQGGRNNTLRNLSIYAADDGGPLVIDSNKSKLQRINFSVDIDAGAVYIGGRGTTVSNSTFQTFGDARGSPLLVLGAGAVASRNTFFGAAQGEASLLVKAGARAEYNTIEWEPKFVWPPVQNLLAAVVVEGNGALIRSNTVRISAMKDDTYSRIIAVRVDGSRNTVKGNTIVASAPDMPSVGIYVSPQSTNDLIQRNRISGGDSEGDIGIKVLGSRCTIFDNKTDSVIVVGSRNIAKRNAPHTR